MRIAAIAGCVLLAGCAAKVETRYLQTQFSMPSKPDADFTCMGEPDPVLVTDDATDAEYKRLMRRAWIDCRDRLAASGEVWRSTEKALVEMKSRAIPPQE